MEPSVKKGTERRGEKKRLSNSLSNALHLQLTHTMVDRSVWKAERGVRKGG